MFWDKVPLCCLAGLVLPVSASGVLDPSGWNLGFKVCFFWTVILSLGELTKYSSSQAAYWLKLKTQKYWRRVKGPFTDTMISTASLTICQNCPWGCTLDALSQLIIYLSKHDKYTIWPTNHGVVLGVGLRALHTLATHLAPSFFKFH